MRGERGRVSRNVVRVVHRIKYIRIKVSGHQWGNAPDSVKVITSIAESHTRLWTLRGDICNVLHRKFGV